MKLQTERDPSYIDPLTVEFFQNNGTSSFSVILLTNGRKEGQTNCCKFNTSLAEVINMGGEHCPPYSPHWHHKRTSKVVKNIDCGYYTTLMQRIQEQR